MNTNWFIDTHGDPLGIIRILLVDAWESFNLDMIMLSCNGSRRPRLINDPGQLYQVNPFNPLMTRNTAEFLPHILEQHSETRIGIVLRPCEMRALEEKTKRMAYGKESERKGSCRIARSIKVNRG